MRISQKLVLEFLMGSLCVGAMAFICLSRLQRIAEPLNKEIPQTIQDVNEKSHLDSLAQLMRYYDEVLTQSARNYAFTQDNKWEQRYRNTEPKLDKIIKEALEKGDGRDKELFSNIDTANLALVKMEYESIELVNNGKAQEAVRILQNSEYQDQKNIYGQGLLDYISEQGMEYDYAISTSTKKIESANRHAQDLIRTSTLWILSFVIFILLILVGTNSIIFYSIANPIAKLKTAASEIGQGRLETKVKIDSNDEIGELAAAFNSMAGNLMQITTSNNKLNKEINERKLAEEMLKVSEEKFRTIFNNSNDGIIITDLETKRFHDANKSLCQMLGYSLEEFKMLGVTNIHPKEHLPYVMEQIEKQSKDSLAPAIDLPMRRKDGSIFYASVLGTKMNLVEKDYMVAIFRDITERKRAEEAILRATNEWENTFDSINDVITIHDLDFNILHANKAALTTFGLNSQEIIGKKCYQIYHHKEYPPDYCPGCQILKTGVPVKGEFYEPALNCYLELQACPRLDENNNIEGLVHIAKNITERKHTEQKNRELAVIVEFSNDAIIGKDLNGIITSWNKAAEIIYGYTEAEVIGKSISVLTTKERQDEALQLLEKIKNGEYVEHFETVRLTKYGKRIDVSLTISPIKNTKGEVIGASTIARDISERKRGEEQREKILKELEKVNRELNDFAYVISHDLKAPLRGISTLTDWITNDYADKLDDDGKEHLKLLSSRVSRMHNLIEGVLQYSKVGRVRETRVTVNLNEIVSEVIDMICPPENITISIETELPVIRCERTRILQVFQNLLSNAVKYIDKPQGLIIIDCIEEDDYWQFSVSDNGPGIEEKYFNKIFQIFQTLSSGENFESTGVGLTIAKKIVEMYGGRIWVESVPGEGTTFLFTLSKHEAEVNNAQYQTNNAN
jgi:two-component system, LuxR family, sensor kinase FixL